MPPPTLLSIFPDPKDLLAVEPEELAAILVEIIPGVSQSAGFSIASLIVPLFPSQGGGYPPGRQNEFIFAVGGALSWMITQGLVIRNPTQPADWYMLTRRGRRLKTRADVSTYTKGRALPIELLQPRLAEKVRHLFLRGDHDTAVFQAFKEVEIAVRNAANGKGACYPDDLVGVKLMGKAFNPDGGPLTDMTLVPAERNADAALFTGAIGHGKNPPGHRDVNIEPKDSARLIMLASYLLDVVAKRGAPQ